MKRMIAVALATTLLSSTPVMAQSGYERGYDRDWNSNEFWRGAPSGVWERIRYLEQRIDRGINDGTLTRREADRARIQLRRIRQDAASMRRNGLDPSESSRIQASLDEVSRNIRWARRNDNYRGDRYSGRDSRDYDRYRTDYDASRYYRDGNYQERYLSENDEIYRGSDGRYYCKRSDGTTGLIIGGGAGALLGGAVSDGIGGALIGGALGALLGRSVDRNRDDIRCR
jgi:hypothetical protein